jgi:hypothetical protein
MHLVFVAIARTKSIRTTAEAGRNGTFGHSPKQVLKLLDNINIKIISELLRQPDISSLALAKKLDIPLSTLQRRRARIENAILEKLYF